MEKAWLHNNDRQNLIIFCNGWGMDGGPLSFLASSDYDVYMLYDYRKLNNIPDIGAIAGKYRQVHLVSWSMGVWIGQKLFSTTAHLLHRTIAINGTLCPIDDRYGIPVRVFDATMAEFNESARAKFYKRMCREKNNLKMFLQHQPQRSLQEQGEELAALREMVDCLPVDESIYREILVSEKDFIMPTVNQLDYWQPMPTEQVRPVSGFHFLFGLFSSWEQLLDFAGAAPNG